MKVKVSTVTREADRRSRDESGLCSRQDETKQPRSWQVVVSKSVIRLVVEWAGLAAWHMLMMVSKGGATKATRDHEGQERVGHRAEEGYRKDERSLFSAHS